METATIFIVGFVNHIPKGALLLVSDSPMTPEGVKTSRSDKAVTEKFVRQHLEIGIDSLIELRDSGRVGHASAVRVRRVIHGALPRPRHVGLKVIGVLKLFSGATALAVGIGVFRFLGHDPGPHAERIVTHLGLDPHNHIIHEVICRITGIDRTHLRAIEFGTFFYAALHTVEGIGLILGYHWAEYLVIVATGSLIPFEIYEIARKLSPRPGRTLRRERRAS